MGISGQEMENRSLGSRWSSRMRRGQVEDHIYRYHQHQYPGSLASVGAKEAESREYEESGAATEITEC